jgi:hypothetical protein
MKKKAFISALGHMGRRHAIALAKLGFDLTTLEPNRLALESFMEDLAAADLTDVDVNVDKRPSGIFDVAIFSETTPSRLSNFLSFNSSACAGKTLLEKPLSADPETYAEFCAVSAANTTGLTCVNFIRRTWPHINILAELCSGEKNFSVMVNGGAVGLGCNGIHFLDMFLYLSGDDYPAVRFADICEEMVSSGRGDEFKDFGGDFVVEGSKGRLFASFSSKSSAGPVMVVRGEHFLVEVDYVNWRWKVMQRKSSSSLPLYRYGADYELVREEKLSIPTVEDVTMGWVRGHYDLPTLSASMPAHNLLNEILISGGKFPPYQFT